MIDPSVGFVIGVAIAIDNLSEGMSIGELALAESTGSGAPPRRRILGWTATLALAALASTLVGWFFLRTLDTAVLAFLLAMGAGGMLYLTASSLLPEAHERHYQQSATLAMAAGFVLIFALSNLGGGS